MRIAKAGRNGRLHSRLNRMLLRCVQHPCDRIHRLHEIAALGQCHCALSAAAPNFKNPFPSRNRKLVDPSQHNLQALPINRAFDSILCVNIPPLYQVRLKVRIDHPLMSDAVRNNSLKRW